MAKVELNVLFKKIQKDDKKEVLEFHVQGEKLPSSQDLVLMAGTIVVLEVLESEAGKFNAEFKAIQRDSKKTTLKFNVKGDSDDKMIELYPFAGTNTQITLEAAQMSTEEFYEEEDTSGLSYSVKDGVVEVHQEEVQGQLTLDEIASGAEEESKPVDKAVENEDNSSDNDLPFDDMDEDELD